MYKIKQYTKDKAQELNVIVKPSKNKNKKIDVFKNDKKIASIGDINYLNNDYPTYLIERGKEYADKRKSLYHQRHKKDNGINGKYARLLLW